MSGESHGPALQSDIYHCLDSCQAKACPNSMTAQGRAGLHYSNGQLGSQMANNVILWWKILPGSERIVQDTVTWRALVCQIQAELGFGILCSKSLLCYLATAGLQGSLLTSLHLFFCDFSPFKGWVVLWVGCFFGFFSWALLRVAPVSCHCCCVVIQDNN